MHTAMPTTTPAMAPPDSTGPLVWRVSTTSGGIHDVAGDGVGECDGGVSKMTCREPLGAEEATHRRPTAQMTTGAAKGLRVRSRNRSAPSTACKASTSPVVVLMNSTPLASRAPGPARGVWQPQHSQLRPCSSSKAQAKPIPLHCIRVPGPFCSSPMNAPESAI